MFKKHTQLCHLTVDYVRFLLATFWNISTPLFCGFLKERHRMEVLPEMDYSINVNLILMNHEEIHVNDNNIFLTQNF